MIAAVPTPEEIIRHHDDETPPGQTPWVGGATPQVGIEIVNPDRAWPGRYDDLAARIRDALGWRVLALDHIGSTSVPGLPAKPIVDACLVVADPAEEASYLPPLEAAGFVLTVREPWWHEHRVLRHPQPRCNLHVFGPAAPEPIRLRIFRDWLRGNPDELALYRDAKLAAAEAANERDEHTMEYNARKEQVIREIYDRAFRAAGLVP